MQTDKLNNDKLDEFYCKIFLVTKEWQYHK